MFNVQSSRSSYLLLLIILLASCGMQKEIHRSGEQVIKDSSLLKAHVGISIFEPATNKYWFNYQGDKYFVPASNTKLPTCYAAMKYLGDSLVGLRYDVVNDTLISIKPTGDPTFLHSDFNSQRIYSLLQKYTHVEIYPIKYDFQYL